MTISILRAAASRVRGRRKVSLAAGILFPLFLLLFSCASASASTAAGPDPAASLAAAIPPQRLQPQLPPRTPPERPQAPENILGAGRIPAEKLAAFLLGRNPSVDPDYVRELARLYVQEAAAEGVNHDVAFSQMCLETGYLTFGGLVQPEWFNYAGIGAISSEQPGDRFPSPRIGVRAQIQHLKAYATCDPPTQGLVDPRYRLVRPGSSPTINGLAGAWATDADYSRKLKQMLDRLYREAFGA